MIADDDFDALKIGDYIITKPEEYLLPARDGVIARINNIREYPNEYPVRANFLFTDNVLLLKSEIIKKITRKENPEYFLWNIKQKNSMVKQ